MVDYDPKEHPYGLLEWVPAGAESCTRYLSVGIKYENNLEESTKKIGASAYEIRLRRKTIYVASTSSRNYYHMPKVDVLLPIPDSPVDFLDLGLNKILINPYHASTSFNSRPFINAGIDVVCDSGGFQLGRGVIDFLDPVDTVQYFNRRATIGVALDIPMHPDHHSKWLMRAAKIQRANNEIFKKYRKEGVRLLNVSHGYSTDLRRKYLDVVYDPDLDGMALGGIGTKNRQDKIMGTHDAILNLLLVIDHLPKDTYYHILGTTSPLFLLAYSLILATGYAKHISCDSVTHYQSQFNGRYQLANYGRLRSDLGREALPGYGGYLPCSCAICTLVGDPRILEIRDVSLYHNLAYQARLAETAHHSAISFVQGHLSFKDLLIVNLGEALYKQHSALFHYLVEVCSKGFKKVPQPNIPKVKQSLLSGVSLPDTSVATVVRKYEEYHGIKTKA